MSVIDDVVLLLKNGEWLELKDIAQKIVLSSAKTELVINFLAEFDFIHLNKETKKAKLQLPILKFINPFSV